MTIYLYIDFLVLLISFLVLNFQKRLTFYHPGTLLLFYHILAYSFRALALTNGAEFFGDASIKEANMEEINRALFWADISLLFSSIAIFIAENKSVKVSALTFRPIIDKLLNRVLFLTIPIGIWGAATYLFIPSVGTPMKRLDETFNSNYLTMTQTWFGLSVLSLVYFKGFKLKYLIPLFVYLFIIAIQGGLRTRLIIPCIFLTGTYLFVHRLKWPTKQQLVLLFTLMILFYPLKEVGRALQQGKSLSEVGAIVIEGATIVSQGNAADQSFLDQYAMALTEIDRKDVLYYGGTIFPLLVLPVPRLLYPEKPSVAQWAVDLSSVERRFDLVGAALSLYGESYLNFSYLGIMFIPAFLFYFLTRWYKRTLLKEILDIDRFFYLLIFCSMIQVMRDGLSSLIIFPVINSMPMFLIYVLHKVYSKPKTVTVMV